MGIVPHPSRFLALFVVLSGLLPLAACRSRQSLTPQQAAGKHVYQVACAHCHEQNDLALKKVPPNLHHLFSRQTLPDGTPATDDQVRRVILNGKGLMPPFRYQITPDQLNAVVAYLHTGLR